MKNDKKTKFSEARQTIDDTSFDSEKQIQKLAAFLLAEFPTSIEEGEKIVDAAIRLLKLYKEATAAIEKAIDIILKTLEGAKS